jgi:hypothetical protein
VLVLPFLIVSAMLWVRFWPPLLMLVVVATSQVTWPVWLHTAPGRWAGIEQQITKTHQTRVAILSPEQKQSAPRLSDVLDERRQVYLEERSRTVAYEWFLTVLALLGAAATVAAAGSIRPNAAGPPGREPDASEARTP